MKNILILTVLLSAFSVASHAQTSKSTPKPEEDVVRISTTLIQLDVTVTDKKGNPITDLKPEEVEIYENGKRQEISNFTFIPYVKTAVPKLKTKPDPNSPPIPSILKPNEVKRTIALIVDDLSLSFGSVYFTREAMKRFVDEQMQEGDLVAIIRSGAGIGALQQFTSNKQQLHAAIEKIRWNPLGTGGISAFAPIEAGLQSEAPASTDDAPQQQDAQRELDNLRESIFSSGTLGAVNYVIRGMRELPGRKSVMLFSDGFKLIVTDGSGFNGTSRSLDAMKALVDLANRSSVVIYAIDPRGLQTIGLSAEDNTTDMTSDQIEGVLSARRKELWDTQEGLQVLARETGGLSFVNSNDINYGLQRMLDDQSYYLVGYQPDSDVFDPKKRKFNKLSIKVNRKDAVVRYRSGFFGISDEERATVPSTSPRDQILKALLSPFGVNDISLRLNALFENTPKGSFVKTLLHIDARSLKYAQDKNGVRKAVFDVVAMSFGENGQPVNQIAKEFTLTVNSTDEKDIPERGMVYYFAFPVKSPGGYQYRVALRDAQSGAIGSASQFIDVPDLKKRRLTLSGVLLDNMTLDKWNEVSNGGGKRGDVMTDTSLRRFKRGSILAYGFDIYNTKKKNGVTDLSSRLRIFHDGKIVMDGKATPIDLNGQNDLERIKTSGALALAGKMPPGEYILQIIVTDNFAKESKRMATQYIQFEIIE